MSTKHLLFRVMGVLFLVAAAGLLGATLLVKDQMGMGYLMGLFTVTWCNATLLFTLSHSSTRGLLTASQPAQPAS